MRSLTFDTLETPQCLLHTFQSNFPLQVIRMCYRALTNEEEGVEEQIMANWEAFLFQMQDAMEFVNTQTPIITQNLDETYQVQELAQLQYACFRFLICMHIIVQSSLFPILAQIYFYPTLVYLYFCMYYLSC